MTPEEKVLRAHNMLDVESGIFEVWREYAEKFSITHRRFDRNKETQAQWFADVIDAYGDEITNERNRLFALIPERFKKTLLYDKLMAFMTQLNEANEKLQAEKAQKLKEQHSAIMQKPTQDTQLSNENNS